MQVILKKDIPRLGRIGEIVKVRPGYARNFLLPRSLAVPAISGDLADLEHQKRLVDIHKKNVQKESQEVAGKISGLTVTLKRRFNEAGKLFGSITNADISAELKAVHHYDIDRRDIEFDDVQVPGDYALKIRLPGDIYAEARLIIEALEEKTAKTAGKKTKAKAKPKKAATEETESKSE